MQRPTMVMVQCPRTKYPRKRILSEAQDKPKAYIVAKAAGGAVRIRDSCIEYPRDFRKMMGRNRRKLYDPAAPARARIALRLN